MMSYMIGRRVAAELLVIQIPALRTRESRLPAKLLSPTLHSSNSVHGFLLRKLPPTKCLVLDVGYADIVVVSAELLRSRAYH